MKTEICTCTLRVEICTKVFCRMCLGTVARCVGLSDAVSECSGPEAGMPPDALRMSFPASRMTALSLHVQVARHSTCTELLSQENSPHHIALPPILTYAAKGVSPMPRQDTYENAPQSTRSTHFFKPENRSFYHFHDTVILIMW